MDRETNQETPPPSLLSNPHTDNNNNNNNNREEDYSSPPRKPPPAPAPAPASAGGGGGGGDRLKRDEWSEGAVSSLLEAYEAKWILRNRAKLKGQDWEDVAKHVSSRANSTKSPKTQTQCKNKIESMKKRYRSESASASAAADASSSWPLYSRLDLLLRGNAQTPAPAPVPATISSSSPHIIVLEPQPQSAAAAAAATSQQPLVVHPLVTPLTALPHGNIAQNSRASNGFDRVPMEDGVGSKLLSDQECDKNAINDTDSSTPAIYSSDKEKLKSSRNYNLKIRNENNNNNSKKKQRRESCAVAESIRWLAEVVVRSEQARMETMKDLERMRAESEAKRGEMDLKRTEIIANTQLEIAKLFAGIAKGVDSSLRIGRS